MQMDKWLMKFVLEESIFDRSISRVAVVVIV